MLGPLQGDRLALPARVQRGPSQAARCASTKGRLVALLSSYRCEYQRNPLFCSVKVA